MIVVPSRTADSTASRWVERFTRTEVALVDHQERFVVSVPEALRLGGRIVVLLRPLERMLGGAR